MTMLAVSYDSPVSQFVAAITGACELYRKRIRSTWKFDNLENFYFIPHYNVQATHSRSKEKTRDQDTHILLRRIKKEIYSFCARCRLRLLFCSQFFSSFFFFCVRVNSIHHSALIIIIILPVFVRQSVIIIIIYRYWRPSLSLRIAFSSSSFIRRIFFFRFCFRCRCACGVRITRLVRSFVRQCFDE